MNKLRLFVSFLCILSAAYGDISVRVYLPDGEELIPTEVNLPHVLYPPVIVGTKVALVIDSNTAEYWSGTLAVADANMDYGVLSCRDSNVPMPDCFDSILPPAGDGAQVIPWVNTGIKGYDLYSGTRNREPGPWFVIDYTPTEVGAGSVDYYDHDVDWFDPVRLLNFPQIRTPDLDGSTIVDFVDWANFSARWPEADCSEPTWCEGADLDGNTRLDFLDVRAFAYYWLKIVDPDAAPYDPRLLEVKQL